MPRFHNIWTADGAIGQCADCKALIYNYKEMLHHSCKHHTMAKEGSHDTTGSANQQPVATSKRTT